MHTAPRRGLKGLILGALTMIFAQMKAKAHGIPVAVVMGGGYSENIDDVVEAHCNTFRMAKRLYE